MPVEDKKTKIGDYNAIMKDRKLFNQTVYTPMSEALKLLDERRKDPELVAKVEKLLKGDIPEVLKNKKCAVIFRQLATPNHESRMFITLAKENNLFPVFFEYHNDKFTPENEFKHSLGQLQVQHTKGVTEKGDPRFEKFTIVDFKKHGGKKFGEIKTLWDEPLTDFHRKLFTVHGYKTDDFNLYNASDWFKRNGPKAIDYYANFFLLFTCFGVLFENFLTYDGEGKFTKDVVLPAIDKVISVAGVKPLITPIGPLEIEADELWYHHLPGVKKHILKT